ncbi:MAG: MFS transporter [Chloroflexi bacterium]|nr:MFS transporter [Chloroflexota bacterium]
MSLSQEDVGGLWSAGRRALIVGLVLTITLVAFEALAVSTVMPIVAAELGDLELYGWVFTAFVLGSIVGIVVSGGLIDRHGLGLPFSIGLGLFTIGLLGGGLAPSMPILVAMRLVQGLGAGAVPPVAYVAIGRSMPERLRPQMFATLSTAWVLPGVLGPAIAGVVGELFGWRLVFLGLLPLIAVAAAIAYPSLRRVGLADPDQRTGNGADPSLQNAPPGDPASAMRRRLPLAFMVAAGTGLFLAGLTSGELVWLIGLGGAGLAMSLPALRRLMPAGTLRAARGLPTAILMRGILTCAFFGVDAYVALTLVDWRGLSPTQAGISLTAATLAWTAGSWIQARFATRFTPERFVQVGIFVLVVGLALFGLVLLPVVTPWAAVPIFSVAGLAMGLSYSPLTLIVLRSAGSAEQGAATSALSLSDSLGTALGTGITGAVIAASVRQTGQPVGGLAVGFGLAAAISFVGLILSSRLGPAVDARSAVSGVPVGRGLR